MVDHSGKGENEMKKALIYAVTLLMMTCSLFAFAACGGDSGAAEEETTAAQEQATEATDSEAESTDETIKAADPLTDEEKATDDSGGCIEDSDDLLY